MCVKSSKTSSTQAKSDQSHFGAKSTNFSGKIDSMKEAKINIDFDYSTKNMT